ncbi:uncharacterized protein LOC134209082 [Armigeres subalbatus]|uniref:uncharacterized protein LOC134209082 n=1 Tax=Armigeres subalbatus TaxID=124917 RepID=UPI002ED46BFB
MSVLTTLEKRRINSKWKDDVINISNKIKLKGTEVVLCWVPSHIGIAGNEKADEEAKRALEIERIGSNVMDINEARTIIKNQFNYKWQAEWTSTRNNKLREVKQGVVPYKKAIGKTRKESVILARLRIGHTLLTHKYLLDKEDPPLCRICNNLLTVKHIFVNCLELGRKRQEIGLPDNLKEALADDEEAAGKEFLKEINLLNEI